MRQEALQVVYELATKDERVVFIGSDLGVGVLSQFKEKLPSRFFMEGVSEAHIVGMAAGLALEGKIPYVNTIATFLTRRCFEQIVLDLCLHNVPARLISNGSGLVYAPLGPTHLAIEDIAILRPVPNISIIAPADAIEMRKLMELTLEHPSPIYFRVAKGGEAKITPPERNYEFGKGVKVCEGEKATILTTGITLHTALKARELLLAENVDAAIVHFPFIKPLDEKLVVELAHSSPVLVTVEEGVLKGGFGSAVAEIIAEMSSRNRAAFKRIGLPDEFPKRYGSQATQLEDFDITAENIVRTVKFLAAEKG